VFTEGEAISQACRFTSVNTEIKAVYNTIMNLKDIKNLISEEGGKLIIADENGPAMVVMSYSDYKRLKNPSFCKPEATNELIEQLPIMKEQKEVVVPTKKESFGVEDLPF